MSALLVHIKEPCCCLSEVIVFSLMCIIRLGTVGGGWHGGGVRGSIRSAHIFLWSTHQPLIYFAVCDYNYCHMCVLVWMDSIYHRVKADRCYIVVVCSRLVTDLFFVAVVRTTFYVRVREPESELSFFHPSPTPRNLPNI